MSTELAVIESKGVADVTVTSFSGGDAKGTCLQLNQGWRESIVVDEEAARKTIAVMQAWLDRR